MVDKDASLSQRLRVAVEPRGSPALESIALAEARAKEMDFAPVVNRKFAADLEGDYSQPQVSG